MTAEEYIAIYGANLTEAEKGYIMAFGPPDVPQVGPSRNPYIAGVRIADAPTADPAHAIGYRTPRTEGTRGTRGTQGFARPSDE